VSYATFDPVNCTLSDVTFLPTGLTDLRYEAVNFLDQTIATAEDSPHTGYKLPTNISVVPYPEATDSPLLCTLPAPLRGFRIFDTGLFWTGYGKMYISGDFWGQTPEATAIWGINMQTCEAASSSVTFDTRWAVPFPVTGTDTQVLFLVGHVDTPSIKVMDMETGETVVDATWGLPLSEQFGAAYRVMSFEE
jgi:hypothetical protein